jgi:SsrA-binding protein
MANPPAKTERPVERTVASNRKAWHDYFIDDIFEAGLVLTGTEIKSVRAGKVSLAEGYIRPERGELWLLSVNIAPYHQGNIMNHEPLRRRKLLLHRDEIEEIRRKLQEKGLTAVPLRVYIKGNRAKVEVGLARGKKLYDKRETIAKRDAEMDIRRAMRRAD